MKAYDTILSILYIYFRETLIDESFINIYERKWIEFMKKIHEKLDENFKGISVLIEKASVLNLAKIKEDILEITTDKTLINQVRKLEEEEKDELIEELEQEVEKLKAQLKEVLAKKSKKVGRRESLSEQKKIEIREIYRSGEISMPKLAKKYRVSVGLIHKIINS